MFTLWSYLYSGSPSWWLPVATRGADMICHVTDCLIGHEKLKTTNMKKNKQNKTMDTNKASTCVTEGWPFVCGFMEVMSVFEVVAQLGTYRHSPHEVRGDFFTADLSLPGQKIFQSATQKVSKRVEVVLFLFLTIHSTTHDVSCSLCRANHVMVRGLCACGSFLTCQFRECRRRRGSWLLFSQSPPVKCSRLGSGRSFSLWTAGGNRADQISTRSSQQFG